MERIKWYPRKTLRTNSYPVKFLSFLMEDKKPKVSTKDQEKEAIALVSKNFDTGNLKKLFKGEGINQEDHHSLRTI